MLIQEQVVLDEITFTYPLNIYICLLKCGAFRRITPNLTSIMFGHETQQQPMIFDTANVKLGPTCQQVPILSG